MTSAMSSSVQSVDYVTDPHLSDAVKEFLRPLNEGGPPLESLSKEDARNVLVGAQAAFQVDYSGIDEDEKRITADGYSLTLNIVPNTLTFNASV